MRPATKIGVLLGLGVVAVIAIGLRSASRTPATGPTTPEPDEPKPPVLAPTPPPPPPSVDASVPAPTAEPKVAQKKAPVTKLKQLSEAELLDRLRKAQDTDEYILSYDLAREGLRRFPDSPDAPEMAAMVVKSLARQGKVSEARAEAEVMVNKYAGTKWAREVERHTGAHPTRNQVPPQ
jgi:hypothetical protein